MQSLVSVALPLLGIGQHLLIFNNDGELNGLKIPDSTDLKHTSALASLESYIIGGNNLNVAVFSDARKTFPVAHEPIASLALLYREQLVSLSHTPPPLQKAVQ